MAVDRYELEERAAIMEYDSGLSRAEAERVAACIYGFQSWEEAVEAVSQGEQS